MRDIAGYKGDYKIDDNGRIWSFKNKTPIPLRYWVGSSPYYQVGLSMDGKVRRYLVHRLVAQTYIENPKNLPVVHHKDGDSFNNHPSNLEWTTQQKNIHRSYETMSQTRNYITTKLYKGDLLVGEFGSQKEACAKASEMGASFTSLEKHKIHGEFRLEKV